MASGNAGPAGVIQRLWPQVRDTPDLHLHRLDAQRGAGLFIYMPEGAYRQASFLDGRMITPQTEGGWVPLQHIKDTVLQGPPAGAPVHFIFHMGHTGSTLLSRLLDETGLVQPLREPLVLREWAELHDRRGDPGSLMSPADIDALMEVMLRLWGRCREAGQSAIVKATSTAARVGGPLMTARENARAVYLSMAAEPYMAVLLAAAETVVDIRGHAEERIGRLTAHLGATPKPLYAMGTGELIAASWLAEALTRESLGQRLGARLMMLDFDTLLTELPTTLERVVKHLGLAAGQEHIDRMAKSPILAQYSKAPEHAYSGALRQQIIERSRREHRAEIAEGMTFLSVLAEKHAAVAAVFQ